MQHILGVYVVQRRADAGHVEGHVALLEEHLLAQVVSQIAACLQVHGKVTITPKVGIKQRLHNTKRINK